LVDGTRIMRSGGGDVADLSRVMHLAVPIAVGIMIGVFMVAAAVATVAVQRGFTHFMWHPTVRVNSGAVSRWWSS